MRKPKQLTLEQRYQIYILRKAGHNQTPDRKALGRAQSTISRNSAATAAAAVTVPSRPRGLRTQGAAVPKTASLNKLGFAWSSC